MSVDITQVYEEIAFDEGKVLHKYLCSESHPTIGIGHKVLDTDAEATLPIHGAYDDVPEEECITEERCYELFQHDIQLAIAGCKGLYHNWEEIPQEMRHILVNMCFQLGQTGLSRFKSMNEGVSQEAWGIVSMEMMDSRWAQQTPERAKRLQNRVLRMMNNLER